MLHVYPGRSTFATAAPTFPVTRPTAPPLAFDFAPVTLFQTFAPVFPPTAFGSSPTLPVGTWTLSPVAVSLDVCVQEDTRLAACLNTAPDTCNPLCGNSLESEYASACESLGLICAITKCCNLCVQEAKVFGICFMDAFQCGDNQCNSSSSGSKAIALRMAFLVSRIGWGMLW